MPRKLWFAIAVLPLLLSGPLAAQPTLESLWPNNDGLRWDYDMTFTSIAEPGYTTTSLLQLLGTVETAGGTAQVLLADQVHPGVAKSTSAALEPLLAAVWRARPDLRPALQARYGERRLAAAWVPLLLHDGSFMKSGTSIQMWQPLWDHPTWTYLTNDLTVGATFTQQLIPEIADDVFLHGTVEAIVASVSTPAGTFTNAVRVGYVIDYGWSDVVDQSSAVTGRYRGETRGHVHYVPDVGPVEMAEDFVPIVELECSVTGCDPFPDLDFGIGELVQTFTLSLQHLPVSIASRSWSEVKELYQR